MCKVSTQTVSRAIVKRPDARPKPGMAEKAIAEMGYRLGWRAARAATQLHAGSRYRRSEMSVFQTLGVSPRVGHSGYA
jgi:DNA-binding LacI/PurR family transcriptional regulator